MAEALRLDILIDENGEARRAVEEFSASLRKAGIDAESAAKQVDKFEQEYLSAAAAAKKATDATAQATTQTKAAGQAAEAAAVAKTKQATATDALVGAAKRYVAPAVIGAAVMKTLEWADNLTNLSKSTGISVTSLQKFEQIGKLSGATMDQIANASLQLSNRLAGGDKSAAQAVEKLGLNLDKLKASKPDDVMLSFARALSKVEDPQQRVALAMDMMGRSGATMIPTLMELAEKWDTVSAKLDEKGVKALDDAGDSLDEMMSAGKALIATVLVPFAPLLTGISTILTPLSALLREFMGFVTAPLNIDSWKQWADQLKDAAASMAYMVGVGPGITGSLPGMPSAPGSPFMPQGLPVPGSPMDGAAGQSWSFLNRFTGGKNTGVAGGMGGVTPYTANQWANIMQVLGPTNPLGNGGLGSFPGWATPALLGAGGSPISFANGSGLMGTVGMNAPGGGGGIGGWLSGHKGQLAGLGIGLAGQYLGSRLGGKAGGAISGAASGASMGMMFGPWGAAAGGLIGGIAGLFGASKRQSAERKELASMKSGEDFMAIKAKAEELGISMDKVFSAKKIEDFQKALSGVTAQIAEQEAETNRVKDAMERWGLTIEDMGPKFKQTEMDKAAKGFTEDFYSLVNAGADVNKVIEKMGPEIGKFVHSSIEMGTQVPLEMKKIIEKMIEQGTLLDKNGEKFTDISQIPFAENLNTQFSSLIDKLDALLDRVFGLGDAFDKAAGSAGNFNREAGNATYPEGDSTVTPARGGIVMGRGKLLHFEKGGFVPRGTDSVPAMLTPGEMVIARDQVKAMARGGRPSSVTVNLNIAGYLDSPKVQREITQVVIEAIDRDARMRRAG